MENENQNWNIQWPSSKRGRIKKSSFGSTKRAQRVLRNIIGKMTHEIGLTYPSSFPMDGEVIKSHLHKFKLRLSYRGIELFWYMEFQKRGAAHFHGLITEAIEESELKRMWYEIVDSGDPKHLRHGAHIEPIRVKEGFLHYLTGYLTKQEQKTVPENFRNLGRYWGYSLSLLPITIKYIIGTPEEIQKFKASIRSARRWNDSQKRNWKSKRKFKMKGNKYALYLPGEYLTIRNGRKWIDEMESRGFDMSLFK